MSYLNEKEIENLLKIINIISINDINISNYKFNCGKAKEYEDFLKENALLFDELCISKTFVMIHKKTNELIGYFTLSADTVKLTDDEKERSELGEVKFMSLPALKIGKLAINKSLSDNAKQKGYGSLAIEIANSYAFEMIETGIACRFLTVDADIEYDEKTTEFYEKNGFEYNLAIKRKPTSKTISMRRDIFHCDADNIPK